MTLWAELGTCRLLNCFGCSGVKYAKAKGDIVTTEPRPRGAEGDEAVFNGLDVELLLTAQVTEVLR